MKDGTLKFRGHNGYPDYPAGQLRTSIKDIVSIYEGLLNHSFGRFILSSYTVGRILPHPEINQLGYFTWFLQPYNDHQFYVHRGGDIGVSTIVAIDVVHKNAIIILANKQAKLEGLVKKIDQLLVHQNSN